MLDNDGHRNGPLQGLIIVYGNVTEGASLVETETPDRVGQSQRKVELSRFYMKVSDCIEWWER